MTRKNFQELTLSNTFLFSAALSIPEICKLILQVILGYPITTLTVHAEHSILYSSDFRSVRLDIYASDELHVNYDLEMQNKNYHNLPQRSRYYQAEMDISSLKPGEDYNNLKPSFVIFICTFDPFERGLYQYTFEPRCLESDFPLQDGTKRIFLNTKGHNPESVSQTLIHFLKYVENGTDEYVSESCDATLNELHSRIAKLKENRALEVRYMQMEELFLEREHDGEARGEAREQERYSNLILMLARDGKNECIVKAAADSSFLKKLYRDYEL